jgi:hypothetical protein
VEMAISRMLLCPSLPSSLYRHHNTASINSLIVHGVMLCRGCDSHSHRFHPQKGRPPWSPLVDTNKAPLHREEPVRIAGLHIFWCRSLCADVTAGEASCIWLLTRIVTVAWNSYL